MKKNYITFLVLLIFVVEASAQMCDCIEYLYINEPQADQVFKYKINADGTLTDGFPFLTGIDSPHGLGTDQNGNIYIGETSSRGNIWKVSCKGDVISTDFILDTGHNFTSIDNILYVGGRSTDLAFVRTYDLCTGNLIGSIELCDDPDNRWLWGFSYNPVTELFYASERGGDGSIFIFSQDDFTNGQCLTAAFTAPHLANALGGVTSDEQGNIYVASNISNGNEIVKYDPNGNFLATSGVDNAEDGVGWFGLNGVVYNSFCNCLYSSARTDIDDCIAHWDTDLNYLGAGVPPQPGGTDNRTKAIGTAIECCPTSNISNIDATVCADEASELSLTDLVGCGGPVCEGIWEEVPGNDIGFTYSSCDNTVAIEDDTEGCSSYTLSSDGTNNNSICDPFVITVNLCIVCGDPCPPENCISQFGEFTITKRRP